ncbi:MAG: hypothetical protein MRQ07_03575 [Candidatus Midichloria sp.]|nr:hypothetical protein [Candidatus Midichloria sp.]
MWERATGVLASLILGIGAFLGYKSYQHKLTHKVYNNDETTQMTDVSQYIKQLKSNQPPVDTYFHDNLSTEPVTTHINLRREELLRNAAETELSTARVAWDATLYETDSRYYCKPNTRLESTAL